MDDITLATNDPVAVAEAVRAKRGLSAINPNRIEGFGADDAPAPDFSNPYPDIPAEVRAQVETPTRTFDEAQAQFNAIQPERERVEVWYEGAKVPLDQPLLDKVERLILEMVVRKTNERLKALAPRAERTKPIPRGASSPVESTPPRRRGRPKGSKNKPKEPSDGLAVGENGATE